MISLSMKNYQKRSLKSTSLKYFLRKPTPLEDCLKNAKNKKNEKEKYLFSIKNFFKT